MKSKAKESKIARVHEIEISADALVTRLLALSAERRVCILDSCGVGHLGSHLLLAGIDPVETLKISKDDPDETLRIFEEKLSGDLAGMFTISYDLGLNLEKIEPRIKEISSVAEPDIYLALFDALVVHDYDSGKTFLTGKVERFDGIVGELSIVEPEADHPFTDTTPKITSNFTMAGYLEAIETIKEYIRSGDTYQTNLTQQLRVEVPRDLTPGHIFWRLRRDHPAPFAAFIERGDSTVVSASPERFFKVTPNNLISTSPIKGTRPRGVTPEQDADLRNELLASAKDRAENVMIVDLLRNDIGRVCEFGSVRIEKLCELEEHPTLFHLVSTITGELRQDTEVSDILRAVLPCGSITGAPKIRTMRIIDEIETASRGLSMGAIGCHIPVGGAWGDVSGMLDLSVAIRTMVVQNGEAVFNVGGGIVIDSIAENEYEETLLKAKALLNALN